MTPETLQATASDPEPGSRFNPAALRDYGIVFALIAVFVGLAVSTSGFLTQINLLNILDQTAPVGIMACGVTLVLICGGFDLSVVAVYALAGIIAADTVSALGPVLAIVVGCVAGLAAGVANGFLVTVVRINPFVATLATSVVFDGIGLGLTGGQLIITNSASFTVLGRNEFLGLKFSIYSFIIVVAIFELLLQKTHFGRYIYATGGNPVAARLSGVRTGLIRTATFGLSGLAAAVGGVIVASRVAAGEVDSGTTDLLFNVYAGVIIGGTSIAGGFGAIWRTVIGVLLLALIDNGFILLNISDTYQDIFFGLIIVFAVGVDVWTRRTTSA